MGVKIYELETKTIFVFHVIYGDININVPLHLL